MENTHSRNEEIQKYSFKFFSSLWLREKITSQPAIGVALNPTQAGVVIP